ncbi:MAG: hypothetical protein J7559_16550 [Cohnella sp.]|nr:hypothetical protein [Cohnella sp.]
MKDRMSCAITVEEFTKLVSRELGLTYAEHAEFLTRAESVLKMETNWALLPGSYAYYADDAFRRLREISREEAASLMAIASEQIGEYSPKLSRQDVVRTISRYKDAKLVSDWAMQALATAVEQQWIGCPDAEIKPKHYMTPYEAMTIVKRFATAFQ